VEVVVFNEIGDGPLQLTREFIRDLVHFPLNGLVVTFQLPVSLGMEGCRQDMPDANKVQIVPENSADVSHPIVREQFGVVMFLLGGLSKLIEGILIVLGKENPEVLLGEKGDNSDA